MRDLWNSFWGNKQPTEASAKPDKLDQTPLKPEKWVILPGEKVEAKPQSNMQPKIKTETLPKKDAKKINNPDLAVSLLQDTEAQPPKMVVAQGAPVKWEDSPALLARKATAAKKPSSAQQPAQKKTFTA